MKLSVVCYLDSEASSKVRAVQKELSELTKARASLEMWRPHITVGDGIEVDEAELDALLPQLEKIAGGAISFYGELQGILKIDSRTGGVGERTTPYGLYLDVAKVGALLRLVGALASVTRNVCKWYLMPRPYHPHCALAFKDLDKTGFEAGAKFLDNQTIHIQAFISHVSLVEMREGDTREFARFELNQYIDR